MSAPARPRVWIDTDVALGADRGDVDDGFALAALLAAHASGAIDVAGISTVYGNSSAALSERCALELSRRAGVRVPVVRGAQRRGQPSSGGEAIAALPADATLLCLGPLTNLADACRRDPALPLRLDVSAVGGNLSSAGFLPPLWPFEYNLVADLGAARRLLALPWKSLTLYPLDVVRLLEVGRFELDRLAAGSALGSYLVKSSERWLRRSRWRYLKPRFPVWDLVAALGAMGRLEKEVFETRRLAVGARVLLRPRRALRCLVSFDPAAAWSVFSGLIADGRL